jgi:hypothetical protein
MGSELAKRAGDTAIPAPTIIIFTRLFKANLLWDFAFRGRP